MPDKTLTYYIFDQFPGYWQGWTLAVLATSEQDARNYVRAWHRCKAHLQRKVTGGKVDAHCGGVTEAAQAILRSQREQETLL